MNTENQIIESWGRGIEKIIGLCLSSGLPKPVFETRFGGLQIEFTSKQENEETKMREKMREKILDLIKTNPGITILALVQQTGKSHSTIERNLLKMQKDNIIERVGPNKGGHWKVIE